MTTNDRLKIAIGRLPAPTSGLLGRALEFAGIAGRHFGIWRKLGYPDEILAGPFAGMRYLPTGAGSAIVPKWIGTYEMELRGVLDRWGEVGFSRLIDVGSADGYYAVGLAIRYDVPAIGFDTSEYARSVMRKIVEINGRLDSIEICGACAPADLEACLQPLNRPLVLVDCEGFEEVLLDPEKAPSLAKSWILVESHDIFRPGMADLLRRRFSASHHVETISVEDRDCAEIARTWNLSQDDAVFAVEEGRPKDMVWLAMDPRLGAGDPA